MSKVKCLCNVRESVMLAPGVFSLWLDAPEIAESAVPGQFVSIYTKSEARLLPRPISICEINREEKTMRFVYRVVGEGTKEFSELSAGDTIEVLGPLGNGFRNPTDACPGKGMQRTSDGCAGIPRCDDVFERRI